MPPEYRPTQETTAAHEAGHAIVYSALGIPVDYVEIREHLVEQDGKRFRRFGWTKARIDDWKKSVSPTCHFIRRAVANAAGVVGEGAAGIKKEGQEPWRGAEDDLGQVAACLVELDVIKPGEVAQGPILAVFVREAENVLDLHKDAFDALRKRLLANVGQRIPIAPIASIRADADDEAVLNALLAKQPKSP
jgi:hypothetical protein